MLIKGIFTDVEVNNQPPEFARHLKNVILTEKLGTPINEPGFVVCVPDSDIPYEVNGVYVIDEAIVLWSTDNTNSEIGVVENCLYKTIINDNTFSSGSLAFNTSFPIDAQHYVNFNSERVVAWIDDINEPRILNIDNFNIQELNDIRIFPFANTPDLEFIVRDSGGSLESGAHQIVVSYANRNGLETNWFALGKPLSITDNPLSIGNTNYDGIEAGVITSKSVEIAVTNADTRFELLKIGVVKTINSIVTAQFVKEVPIGDANFSTVYTGAEGTITDITLDEILVPSASYKTAKAIGQVNNKLYLGNLTVEEEIDLSAVALDVKLEWHAAMATSGPSLTDDSGNNKNPNNDVGFWPGEVYAFYLVGEKLDGTLTKGFHIPGRESVPSDFDLNTAAATGQLADNPMNYEVDSTTQNEQLLAFGFGSQGDFGYWENKNEVYADPEIIVESIVVPGSSVEILGDYYLRIATSTEAKLSDFVVGEDLTLTDFTTGNGTHTIVSAAVIGDYFEILLGPGQVIIEGTGTVSYTRTTTINNNLPTGKVRHHRFPTLNKLRSLSIVPTSIGRFTFPRLTVKASNVIMPPELQGKITKWFITWAKRTPANATVMGQAPYQYAGVLDDDYRETPESSSGNDTALGKKFSPSVGNFIIGNTRNDQPGSGEQTGRFWSNQFPHQEVIKFNSFELIKGKPSMGSLYLRQEVRYSDTQAFADQDQLNPSGSSGNLDSGVYKNLINDGPPEDDKLSRWIMLNHEQQFNTSETRDADLLREVSNFTYLPANVIDLSALGLGGDLRMSEESLFLRVKGGQPVSNIADYNVSPDPNGIPALDLSIEFRMTGEGSVSTSTKEEGFLSTLCQRKDNVYTPFTEQEQVICTGKALSSETEAFFQGGDARIYYTGMKQLAPYAADPKFQNAYTLGGGEGEPGKGTMGIIYFGGYSTKNTGLRYLDNAQVSSFYFPKVIDFYNGIFDISLSGNYRTLLYNEDYTLVNEYNVIGIHNPATIPAATILPHTIASSTTNELEERTISWQNFLSADRYVMPRNKGPIINLQGVSNDRLFIHQRDSLFITRSTTTLKGDITDVTLGSGDLFSVTPTEVLSTDEGFGGTQHKFACKLTKAGYAFPDVAQGKIFLHSGSQLEEISKNGQRIFFRDNIKKDLEDNPFQGRGITITYDEKYNRLMVGVRDGTLSFTTSYAPATQAWASFHDYFPEFLIETRRKLFSLKNNNPTPGYQGIYEHNVGAFGVYYNVIEATPVPFPMLVDLVANPAPFTNKIFGAVEWASEVIQADGVQAKDETIDYITLSNNTKTTGRVELERLVNLSQIHNSNTRNVNEFWYFNGLRDVAVAGIPFRLDFYDDFAIIDANLDYNRPWYKKAKFIDRFVITRFEYSNLNNNRFALLNQTISYRESYR